MQKILPTLLLINILYFTTSVNAQRQTMLDQALRFVESSTSDWNLQKSDVSDLAVSDLYTSQHNGVTHIYLLQQYKGIPIYNAVTSVHIDSRGKVYDSPHRYFSNLSSKINTTKAKIQANEALMNVIKDLGIENALVNNFTKRTDDGKTIFPKTNFTNSDIPVKMVYMPTSDGKLHLAYDLTLDMKTSPDYWCIRVDAVDGKILDKHNQTTYCNFSSKKHNHHVGKLSISPESPKAVAVIQKELNSSPNAANTYRVVPFPTESPLHGPRQLVTDPAYLNASPFGWHDTNGQTGAEYTTTRGNNVNAYLDTNADNANDGNQPNGGSGLNFDFAFDQDLEPSTYRAAAQTNLFYVCNMMHDVLYQFGFDEVSGNFQFNNYNKGGAAQDHVLAEAQDGSGVNNANFSTPSDGASGRMQMYLWTGAASEVSLILPDSLAGYIEAIRGAFGPAAPNMAIEAETAWSDDGSGLATLGCRDSQKKSVLSGKIAFIDRGDCNFSQKCYYAQKAGAVAAIVVGFDDTNLSMAAGNNAGSVTIPSYYLNKKNTDKIRHLIGNGLKLKIQKPDASQKIGPDSLDGDFDNGIIAHEFGHGVSNRLTGGPALSNCLANAENMGEGWSDFMTLIMTAKKSDTRNTIRAVGNYANGDKIDGLGIRRKPYSTDPKINNFSYLNKGTETHDVGEVWTDMLWDLYWDLVDKYGYDPDFKNAAAGNNICIQLVMDGMKLQPCSPGFVDGRNAILKADEINYGGVNKCLIWNAFAKRGLGANANQGGTNVNGDEKEDFEPIPICVGKLLVSKKAVQLVKAGDEYQVTITVKNYKAGTADNVSIVENIPLGCTYVAGSASLTPSNTTNDKITWTIASMASLAVQDITFKYKTDPGKKSTTLYYNDFEASNELDKWTSDLDISKNGTFWDLIPTLGVDGSTAWFADGSVAAETDAFVYNNDPITINGSNPALFFQHSYNTPQNLEGGFIEVSLNKELWTRIPDAKYLLNGYSGSIDYNTLAIPFLTGFSGNSGGIIPTVADFNTYNNVPFYIRFRYAAEESNVSRGTPIPGWMFDNLEFIEPVFYNSDVCVTTDQGENICVSAAGKGTLVESNKIVKNDDHSRSNAVLRVFPNPAKEYINISMVRASGIEQIRLLDLTGKEIKSISLFKNDNQNFSIPINDLPKGILLVEAIGSKIKLTQKINIQ